MSGIDQFHANSVHFLMGNEAIARGALESGVQFATGYPGTPSSEIIQRLAETAKRLNLHVEWSTNEKAATEGAAAAAFAGLRSLTAMKNAGLSVALDFLTHLSYTGIGDRGGSMVTIVCDDPSAHSSGDETDSRWLARFASMPLLEASTVEEARDAIQWAFSLSEDYGCNVMFRGYTRLCHASGTVRMNPIEAPTRKASSDVTRTINPYLGMPKHAALLEKIERIRVVFEQSPLNGYEGPAKADLVIVCGGNGAPCSQEAVEILGLQGKVAILKIGTLWPFPSRMVLKHLRSAGRVLVAEEVDPYIEVHVKTALSDARMGDIHVFGRESGHIPAFGEITPDRVIDALKTILNVDYTPRDRSYATAVSQAAKDLLISRGLMWCAGCPHRASFWALEKALKADGRDAYVTGDIGCSTLDVFPEGKGQMKLLHAMGSGTGLAAGLGQLGRFGYDQPVIGICGDSTFYHASIPSLINAVHNGSRMTQIVLDNSATAMTGFQSHPGTGFDAVGEPAPAIDLEKLCSTLGCKVTVRDPFDIKGTIKSIRSVLKEEPGVNVLILRRSCEIVRMKKEKKRPYLIRIDQEGCKGEECGICSSEFRCPALIQDPKTGKAQLMEDICAGCGVCADICPFKAIHREECIR